MSFCLASFMYFANVFAVALSEDAQTSPNLVTKLIPPLPSIIGLPFLVRTAPVSILSGLITTTGLPSNPFMSKFNFTLPSSINFCHCGDSSKPFFSNPPQDCKLTAPVLIASSSALPKFLPFNTLTLAVLESFCIPFLILSTIGLYTSSGIDTGT